MATDINIIKVNDKIYFDSDTIAEIRDVSADSCYSYYKDKIEQCEAQINKVFQQINFICLVYEGEKSEREYEKSIDISKITGHNNASDSLKAYTEAQDNQDDNEVTNMR